MTWFGTIWPTCRRRHLTLSNRFAIKRGECTARRKYESCSQRPAGRENQTSSQRLLGSYAPEPSRNAGRLCPEFYKSEFLRPLQRTWRHPCGAPRQVVVVQVAGLLEAAGRSPFGASAAA
jgi:hypothetical protein